MQQEGGGSIGAEAVAVCGKNSHTCCFIRVKSLKKKQKSNCTDFACFIVCTETHSLVTETKYPVTLLSRSLRERVFSKPLITLSIFLISA